MVWGVELSDQAQKGLRQIDPSQAQRILNFLYERVRVIEDPRAIGEALKGPKLGEFWRYRVGDFRIICAILDEALLVLVVRIGNRRDIYRR